MSDYMSKFTGEYIDKILGLSHARNEEVANARGAFDNLNGRFLNGERDIDNLKKEIAKLNPKTLSTQIIEREYLVGNTINVGNHTETRFVLGNKKASSPIDVNAVYTGNEFYAMIVLPVEFSETTYVKTFVRGDVKLLNQGLDITEFSVVHITLFFDGINMCCVVSGY